MVNTLHQIKCIINVGLRAMVIRFMFFFFLFFFLRFNEENEKENCNVLELIMGADIQSVGWAWHTRFMDLN